MGVAEQYFHVLDDVAKTALACGRDPAEITVVAVSKTYPYSHVQPAYEAGCRDFGENRLQEALEKIEEAPTDIRWHLIGSLQRKKVPKVVGHFSLIHSVDSVELAEKISAVSRESGVTTKILLQVNCSGESAKHGLQPQELSSACRAVASLDGVEISGLMTMAPLTDDDTVVRQCFVQLRRLKEQLERIHHCRLPELSMGMSQDYRIAIQEGATLIRLGTVIFGSRDGTYTV